MKLVIGVLCTAALCMVGCATQTDSVDPAEPTDQVDPAEASTAQDVTAPEESVRCSEVTFKVNYYSDASLTTLVGTISCVCFSFERVEGIQTLFSQVAFRRVCTID